MTIITRQSVEHILCSSQGTLVAYPINRYAFVGQRVDMLWSHPGNKGESG